MQELKASLAAVFFLGLGLLTLWIARSLLNVQGDAVFVSLILIPVIVYAIFSGRLKEIRAPGGLEAKFADVATESVETSAEKVEASIDQMQVVAKGEIAELQRTVQQLDETKPVVLTMTLGNVARSHLTPVYDPAALHGYITALSQYRNFKFVVLLDKDGRFVAYVPVWALRHILELTSLGLEFIRAVNERGIQDIQRFPGVVTTTISTKATNVEALRAMTAQNLDALIVIDEDRRLRGVVERERVLSKLLLAMAI